MILEDATYDAYCYYPKDLTHGSAKPILAACDDCGKVRCIQNCQYRNLCRSCTKAGENNHFFGKHHTEESKCKNSEAHKGNKGEKNGNWRGGISFEPYCIKFNKLFKESIRELHYGKCFLCGKTEAENGKKLDVHHVNYNKDCGCDSTKCICVPLCVSCHGRTNGNRDYWEELITIQLKNTLLGW